MSNLKLFKFQNNTGSPIYLETFSHVMIPNGSGTATIPKSEVVDRNCAQLNSLITSGDISLLDDVDNPYSTTKALNIIHGVEDSIIGGGNEGDAIVTDSSGDLVWSPVTLAPTGLTAFHEVVNFYAAGATGDSYLLHDTLNTDQYPHFIALGAGQVVHVSSTREKSPEKWCNIAIRKQASSGTTWNVGTWTDIGSELSMNGTILSDTFTNLTGYTFSAGDAIAVYLKKTGVTNASSVEDPVVNLYIKYD